jgi:hypothetical protein
VHHKHILLGLLLPVTQVWVVVVVVVVPLLQVLWLW